MKNTPACIGALLLLAAAPELSSAATFFTDDFSHGSSLNGTSVPGGTPTASFTSYDIASTKNATACTIAPNDFTMKLNAATTSGFVEAQALFTNNAIALSTIGDYIDISVVFTNTGGTLLAGGTGSLLWVGLFNSSDFLPQRSWPAGQNPWQSYEACRCTPGTATITRGPYNLGLLFFSKAVANPQVFYCPSLGKAGAKGTYSYYTYAGTWPSTPPTDPSGQPEDNVRTGYNYYPQPKDLELVQGYQLPVLTYQSMTFASPNSADPAQSSVSEPSPLKITSMDPNRSVSVDNIQTFDQIAHKNGGKPGGLNALFGDTHVKYETVRAYSAPGQAFDKGLWLDPGPGSTALSYRRIMSYFQP